MDNQFLSIEPKKDTPITSKRQIERGVISKAIYMVTDLFDENEPLRSALRIAAIDMLTDKGEGLISSLKSMLVLSKEIGLVSELNVQILLKAINSLDVDHKRANSSTDLTYVLKVLPDTDSEQSISTTQEVKDSVDSTQGVSSKTAELPKIDNTQTSGSEVTKKVERVAPLASVSPTLDIGTRRKKILEVVRSKGHATIHEFTQSIQGCSSKTIQRELTSLVLSGTLKKTGERRWSKYSLR